MALPNNPTPAELVKAVKDLEQGGGGGTATDVQVDNNSITNNGVANLKTISGNYDETNNPIATKNDLPPFTTLTTIKSINGKHLWKTKTWGGLNSFNKSSIWTDGENIYCSNGSVGVSQYVLDKSTYTWYPKNWEGLGSFFGSDIWTDGENIYYSSASTQYVLNKSTSTWSQKAWTGLTSFSANGIWTDGENIYYSSASTQYVLNKSTSTWSAKTWNGYSTPNGNYVWTDGKNIYYSYNTNQYVLNVSTSTWVSKSWGGLQYINLQGDNIWSDGENIYSTSSTYSIVLDKETSNWVSKVWEGLSRFGGNNIWTDGENIYYSFGNNQYELSSPRNIRVSISTSAKTNPNNFLGLSYAISRRAALADNNTFSGTNNFTGALQKNGVNVATVNDIPTDYVDTSSNQSIGGNKTFSGTVIVDGHEVGCLPSFNETELTKNSTYTPTSNGFIVARPTSNDKNGAYFKIKEVNSSGNLLAGNHGATGTSLGYNTMPTMMIPVSKGLTYYLQCSTSYYEFYFLSALT